MVMLLISFVLSFGYILYVKYKYNVASISESYYYFEKEKKGLGKLFTLWTVSTAFTLLPCWLDVTPDNCQFLAFLSSVILIVIGCFPQYKNIDSFTHPFFTSMCVLLSLVWGIAVNKWIINMLGILIPIILVIVINRHTLVATLKAKGINGLAKYNTLYWIELGAILSIYISVWEI